MLCSLFGFLKPNIPIQILKQRKKSKLTNILYWKLQEVKTSNMHQQGLTRTGNFAVGSYITASDIDFPDSIEDLTTILQTLNSE